MPPGCVTETDGSSPRARGTLGALTSRIGKIRFIPAGAGNTDAGWRSTMKTTVHPRGRGEHAVASFCQRYRPGSSPRARGTQALHIAEQHRHRFIPAGAGNTLHPGRGTILLSVHPRGRGEHSGQPEAPCLYAGSSPRARGTPRAHRRQRQARRFIPAGAGNTGWSRLCASLCAVHPRGRGEHSPDSRPRAENTGSSPRARGTPLDVARPAVPLRFIPAGAGNTSRPSAHCPASPVHPRGRGEHSTIGSV